MVTFWSLEGEGGEAEMVKQSGPGVEEKLPERQSQEKWNVKNSYKVFSLSTAETWQYNMAASIKAIKAHS